jgi:hypothetical protein
MRRAAFKDLLSREWFNIISTVDKEQIVPAILMQPAASHMESHFVMAPMESQEHLPRPAYNVSFFALMIS